MNRTVLAILLLFTLAPFLQGCGMEDPGQPAVGSISVGSKSEEGSKLPPKKGVKPVRAAK